MSTDTHLFDKYSSNGILDKFPYLRIPYCLPLFVLIPSGIIIHLVGGPLSFLAPMLLIIAVPNMFVMYFTSRLMHWQFMLKTIWKPWPDGTTFLERGLYYTGHTTTRISGNKSGEHELLLVDRTIMVCMAKNLTEKDVRGYITYAIKNNIDSICIIQMSIFGTMQKSIDSLVDRHGITVCSLNDVFDMIHEKIRADDSK